MLTIFVQQDGRTRPVEAVHPAWLRPDSGCVVWVDVAGAPGPETRLLTEVFGFHELAVEDALSESHHPKIETYDGYVYRILHGIYFEESQHPGDCPPPGLAPPPSLLVHAASAAPASNSDASFQ